MKKIALSTILALGTALAAPSAFAQTVNPGCPPGSWLCADITVGGSINGSASVGVPQAPPVVVQPYRPPVVYVQPPPPPRVYVTPAPPPVIVYQPQPVYVAQPQYIMPPPTRAQYVPAPQRTAWVGLQGSLSGALLGGAPGRGLSGMGGGNIGLRFRGRGILGAEFQLGAFGGRDYNGDARLEVPLTASGLIYFNPQNAFQVYALAGLGGSWANVNYASNNRAAHGGRSGAEYTYFGGQIGLGFEWQLSPRFSLFADVRGFVRARVDGGRESNPEFARTLSSGTTQTTNTSAGVVSQIGGILYF